MEICTTTILVLRHGPSEFKLKITRISLQVLGSLLDHPCMFKVLHFFVVVVHKKNGCKNGKLTEMCNFEFRV